MPTNIKHHHQRGLSSGLRLSPPKTHGLPRRNISISVAVKLGQFPMHISTSFPALMMVDNREVMYYINNQRGARSQSVCAEA